MWNMEWIGFRGDVVWRSWQTTDGQRMPTYTISSPMSLWLRWAKNLLPGIINPHHSAKKWPSERIFLSVHHTHEVLLYPYPTGISMRLTREKKCCVTRGCKMTLMEQVFAILDVKVHCMLNPHGWKFNYITILKLSEFFRILQYHPVYHSSEVQRHYCGRDVFYIQCIDHITLFTVVLKSSSTTVDGMYFTQCTVIHFIFACTLFRNFFIWDFFVEI